MLRSTFQLTRQLSDALLELPGIVRQFERKSPQVMTTLMDWIRRAEDLLSTHRLVEAAEVSGLKARILAPVFEDDKRGTLRRRQQAVAIGLLHELQLSLQHALQPRALKLEQARDMARQLLQIVAQSGAIVYDPAVDFETMIDRIWALCTQHEQLKPLAAQLKMLLSSDDIRLLLAEELDPADFVDG
jgi:hypothetical protein